MSENQRSNHRVSYSQLEVLWEFLDSHKDIAMGYNKSVQARHRSKVMWDTVAVSLNSHGDGAHKTGKAWNSYWVDYKSKLKKLAAANRASQQRTGGGPAAKPLTDLETKFLGLMGEDFGCGIPGARVEPILDLQERNIMDEHVEILPMSTTSLPERNTPPRNTPPRNMPLQNTPPRNTPPRNMPLQNTPPRNTPPRTLQAHHSGSPVQGHAGARLQRRRRTRGTTTDETRRALITSTENRERIDEARNIKLEEIKQELRCLTGAINSLNDTIKSRFPVSEP